MKNYLVYNYDYFLNIKEVSLIKITLIILIIPIILVFISYNTYIYDNYSGISVYNNNYFNIVLNENLSVKIDDISVIKVNNQEYKVADFKFAMDETNNEWNLQIFIDAKFQDSEEYKIDFHYHKQRVLKYILKLFS